MQDFITHLRDENSLKYLLPFLHLASSYHRYQVVNINAVPHRGKILIAINHSLATYDGMLLGLKISLERGRDPWGLGDRLIFKLPFLKDISPKIGLVEGSWNNATKLLQDNQLVILAPGGMLEALRDRDEKYRVCWHSRKGFTNLAIATQTPLILGACPRADDLYDIKPSKLTKYIYNKWKIPVPLAKGLGPTLLPKPIKLTHYLSDPIIPPFIGPNEPEEIIKEIQDNFHEKCSLKMQELLTMN